MAESYLAEFPTKPCAWCSKPTALILIGLCPSCFELRQRVQNHATRLLADPKAAPHIRALLETALLTKPEPPEAA